MINVAIVEDNNIEASQLAGYLERYQKEHNFKMDIIHFKDADSFLINYRQGYDIIFMDIELPNINGMDAAVKIREYDKKVFLIFVTNMAQFAVKGYQVDALDYIIKPATYQSFVFSLEKALRLIRLNDDTIITVPQSDGIRRIFSRDVIYIEVADHKLSYHTEREIIYGFGSLSALEERLKAEHFMRCNSCYLINPKYIESVSGYTVRMKNGDSLKISKPRKKKFMLELTEWLGQGNFT